MPSRDRRLKFRKRLANRKWRENNPEKVREYQRRRTEKNRERLRQQRKELREEKLEKERQKLEAAYRRLQREEKKKICKKKKTRAASTTIGKNQEEVRVREITTSRQLNGGDLSSKSLFRCETQNKEGRLVLDTITGQMMRRKPAIQSRIRPTAQPCNQQLTLKGSLVDAGAKSFRNNSCQTIAHDEHEGNAHNGNSSESFLGYSTQEKEFHRTACKRMVTQGPRRKTALQRAVVAATTGNPAISGGFAMISADGLSTILRAGSQRFHQIEHIVFGANSRETSCQTIVSYGNMESKPTWGRTRTWTRCVVPGCTVVTGHGVIMHNFPCPLVEPAMRAEWLRRIGLQESQVNGQSRVCRWHFDEKYIRGTGLKPGAKPQITAVAKKKKKTMPYKTEPDESQADDQGPSGLAAISVIGYESAGAYFQPNSTFEVKRELDKMDDDDIDYQQDGTSVRLGLDDPIGNPNQSGVFGRGEQVHLRFEPTDVRGYGFENKARSETVESLYSGALVKREVDDNEDDFIGVVGAN